MSLQYANSGLLSSPSAETPTVFVIDDDVAVRESLAAMIRAAAWQPITVATAEEFLSRPRRMSPSCLLVELHLPGLSGLDLQRLVFDRTEMPIIFMSSVADVQAAVRAMKLGAFEFLTKPLASDGLVNAIRAAIERSRTALCHVTESQALQDRYESLSRREREVMSLVVSGRLNKQVGGALGISEITVKAHRGKMMRKMQAGSFAELVKMAASLHGRRPAVTADLDVIPEFMRHDRYAGASASYARL
jgi:FixJ family two-component response regulator